MTGNELLDFLFTIEDDDSRICELLEMIKQNKDKTLKRVFNGEPSFDFTDKKFIFEVAKLCAVLEYEYWKDLPSWCYNKNFYYDRAYYIGKHLSDFDKVKMFITAPQCFLERNIYFHKAGLKRV